MGLKRKGAERKAEQRILMKDAEDGLVVLLELSDGVMEQVELSGFHSVVLRL
jgi:hypothetical protein